MIQEQYRKVREKIDLACARSGRDPKNVTLIAVSKTKPIEDLHEAYEAGAVILERIRYRRLYRKHHRCQRIPVST